MTQPEELFPLFSNVTISADDASAIVAALRDIAETDGLHENELAMIQSFMEELDADFGTPEPTKLGSMTPERLALEIRDANLRKVTVQCAVLLALADGAISEKERSRVKEYASALDIRGPEYDTVESTMTRWVKTGSLANVL
jgi:tellurite resistance protein